MYIIYIYINYYCTSCCFFHFKMSWSFYTVIPLTHTFQTFQRLSIVVAKGQAPKLRELQTLQALVELCPKGQALQVLVEQTLQALVETCSGDTPRPRQPYIYIYMLTYSKHETLGIYYRFLFIRSYPSFCVGVHK